MFIIMMATLAPPAITWLRLELPASTPSIISVALSPTILWLNMVLVNELIILSTVLREILFKLSGLG